MSISFSADRGASIVPRLARRIRRIPVERINAASGSQRRGPLLYTHQFQRGQRKLSLARTTITVFNLGSSLAAFEKVLKERVDERALQVTLPL